MRASRLMHSTARNNYLAIVRYYIESDASYEIARAMRDEISSQGRHEQASNGSRYYANAPSRGRVDMLMMKYQSA